MIEITIQQFGNSICFVLPEELRARMGLEVGDRVLLIETESGWFFRPSEFDWESQMSAARRIMTKYRGALRRLAN